MADPRVVHVEVNGQRYPIRSALDPVYVQELAAYVDRKMRIAFDSAPSTDALGLAILVALNIADEYFWARDSQQLVDGSVAARAGELERMVDQALELVLSSDRE
jgi:cell division protein ZapA